MKKLKSEGLGYRKIANKLNEEGLKTVRGKVFVGANTFDTQKEEITRWTNQSEIREKDIAV